jgi:hypothetical protein
MASVDLIERAGAAEYRVSLRVGARAIVFLFHVTHRNGLDVVSWDGAFEHVMQRSLGRAQPILAAVLALHQAQACLPDNEVVP